MRTAFSSRGLVNNGASIVWRDFLHRVWRSAFRRRRRIDSRRSGREFVRSFSGQVQALENRCLLTQVTSVLPSSAHHFAPNDNAVGADFDANIDSATVTDQTLVVHARESKRLLSANGDLESITAVANTAVLSPLDEFHAGELVQVTITGQMEDATNTGVTPFSWQFRAATQGGTGAFVDTNQSLGSNGSLDVALGDLDNDGDLDAFVVNADLVTGQGNRVYLNQGGAQMGTHGVFTDSGQSLGSSISNSVELGDLDGDGDLDAFVANGAGLVAAANKVWVNQGGAQNGTAGVFADSGQSLGTGDSEGVALGDVDRDGDLDAFVANDGQANRVWINQGGLQNGTEGVFADSGQALGSAGSTDVVLVDLDDDGVLDAFVSNDSSGDAIWFNLNGIGTSWGAGSTFGTSQGTGIDFGDIDNDSIFDVVVSNRSSQANQTLTNDGTGIFSAGTTFGSSSSNALRLVDVDSDSDLDVFVANGSGQANRVWLNQGFIQGGTIGTFADSGQTLGSGDSYGVAMGDLDGDGDLDAFVANFGQGNRVWRNRSYDFGDAPAPFPTRFEDNGARHEIVTGAPRLGARIDGEDNGQPDPTAGASGVGGDDRFGFGDDEDGVTFGAIRQGSPVSTVTVTASATAKLDAWIDFNGDQSWDAPHDQIFKSEPLVAGTNVLSFVVPPAARIGTTFARFRVSTAGGLSPRGLAVDGEVEDYQVTIAAPTGTGTFVDSGLSLGNDLSESVALGDLDGDGDLDAFVANFDTQGDRVWMNSGTGLFSDSGQSLETDYSNDVALGDLDGDGDLDAFVATASDPERVWRNDGSGVFSAVAQTLPSFSARATALGDFDRDGDLDAFLVKNGVNVVLQNNGNAVFTDSGQTLGSSDGFDVAIADVDGDGDLDAFVANGNGAANRVWLNNGSGTFSDSGQALGTGDSSSVALADVDGDGDLDAFVGNRNQANRVWTNNGSGVFTDSLQSLGTSFTEDVSLGDVDGDGDQDAFVTVFGAPHRVWTNNGSGTFSDSGQTLGTNSNVGSRTMLGDVDGDGDLDAFVGNSYSTGTPNRVWLNVGQDFGDAPDPYPVTIAQNGARHKSTGPFLGGGRDDEPDGIPNAGAGGDDQAGIDDETGVAFGAGVVSPGALAATVTVTASATAKLDAWIDFNGDGSWDVADEQIFLARSLAAGNNNLTFAVPVDAQVGTTFARFRISTAGGLGPRGAAPDGEVEDHPVLIVANGGSGILAHSGQSLGGQDTNTSNPALGDLDGDGDLDAFLPVLFNGNRVFQNNGSGILTNSGQNLGTGGSRDVALGDLDGDGDPDAFVANTGFASGGPNRVWFNNGSATFTVGPQSLGNNDSFAIDLGDVDGDGDLDAFVANNGNPGNRLWLNNGSGTFTDSGQSLGSSLARDVALGDLDNDGDLDAFVPSAIGGHKVWINQGGAQNGTTGVFADSGQTLGTTGGSRVALGDLDGDGDLDAYVGSNAGIPDSPADRVWFNNGSAVFTDGIQSLGTELTEGVALADLDGDGDLDAVTATREAGVRLQTNNGSGVFSPVDSKAGFGGYGIVAGDLDGDGDPDALATDWTSSDVVLFNTRIDFGDAPDPNSGTSAGNYQTLAANNGPRHSIVPGLFMGANVDAELDGQPDEAADLDDGIGVPDDEDGLTDPDGDLSLIVGQVPSVDVTVTNTTGTAATLSGWIDLNGDGVFDNATERASAPVASGTTGAVVSLVFPAVPSGAVSSTYARFRLSTDAAAANPTGPASDGEVEDYSVTIGDYQNIVGRNPSTGQWQIAHSNGSGFTSQIAGAWAASVNWVDVMVADVNGDGHDDVVGRQQSNGNWWVAVSNGTTFTNQLWGFWTPIPWVDVMIADVNGDGSDDVVGRQQSNGNWWVALSNGFDGFTNQLWGGWTAIPWLDVNVADVDGDGNDDVVGRQQSNGNWWVALSDGLTGFFNLKWGNWAPIPWVDVMIADVNGDGNDDVVGRQQSNGNWWVAVSDGVSGFTNELRGAWTPIPWVDVMIADVNGDGNDDIVGRQQSNGVWWVAVSTANVFLNQNWGAWTPIPWVDVMIADVDADGDDDIVGRQQSNGKWWVARSNGTNGFANQFWGTWNPAVAWEDTGIIDELLTI